MTQPTSPFTNRLATEKSPYLLQHAHNPVDWFPWGQPAFDKATRLHLPILLSIGYSTCHWCHVMERESFEDPNIARLINDNFVPVKVDREERPDIDRVYMTFITATTGSGGWPMTVFLTPDLKPFFGGTYFPPADRYGMPGLATLLSRIAHLWQNDRDKLLAQADALTKNLRQATAIDPAPASPISDHTLHAAYDHSLRTFDSAHGGFGSAPKFPRPVELSFLLNHHHRTGQTPALDMVLKTLRAIAAGGIHDHVGGGFHRYSTDARWFLPHFEKMLYDQAQLASAYLDGFQITRDPFFADTAHDILDYVLHDMTGPDGQFYTAEDADSAVDAARPDELAEGRFYLWPADEIAHILGTDIAAIFAHHYGVEPRGNIAHDPHGEFVGFNHLYIAHSLQDTAGAFSRSESEIAQILSDSRQQLITARGRRPRPRLDDKTIVATNGLMISAFARAGPTLAEPRYAAAATAAADFIRARLFDPDTRRLQRRWRAGQAHVHAFLDDYAFLIQGLIDLYECTLEVRWLTWAIELQRTQDDLFWDTTSAGYFTTSGDDPTILLRLKDDSDNAEPAGNSIAARNLLRLAQMTADPALRDKADQMLRLFAGRIHQYPSAMPQLLVAADFLLAKPMQIILAGQPAAADTHALLSEIHACYLPNKIILLADGAQGQEFLSHRIEFLKSLTPLPARATAYVCHNFACDLPTSDPATLRQLLATS